MPRYYYHGRDSSGKETRGVIEGTNESVVSTELLGKGITPIAIKAYSETTSNLRTIIAHIQREYPTLQDLIFFSRQMYSMMKAGVPIVRAVKVVIDSAKNQQLRLALLEVLASLESGMSIGVSMKKHPQIFPGLMIALITVGENTGTLDEVFRQIAIHYEKEANIRKQIKTAIRYPITVLLVVSVAVAVINIFVIPAFARFFDQFKAQLPLPTRILIATSDFFVHYWYILLLAIVGLIVTLIMYIRTRQGRYAWDRWKLSVPLIGSIIRRSLLSRFARSFALCIRTGVPLLDAIGFISKATDNVYVAEQIMTMKTYIEHGESLTASATKSAMFTSLVLQMLAIGEETGEIDRLLDEVADYYEGEVDYDVKRLGDLIEPILIVIIACLVLILALGVFLPMWDIWKVTLGKS